MKHHCCVVGPSFLVFATVVIAITAATCISVAAAESSSLAKGRGGLRGGLIKQKQRQLTTMTTKFDNDLPDDNNTVDDPVLIWNSPGGGMGVWRQNTAAFSTGSSSDNGCIDDVKLIRQTGDTNFPIGAVDIVSQDTKTVEVNLHQLWTTSSTSESTSNIDHIYTYYHQSSFDKRCYETADVPPSKANEEPFDTITITCNVLTPIAYLQICVAEDSKKGTLSPSDNATVPKCCYPTFPPDETNVVCYSLEISCVSTCNNDREETETDSPSITTSTTPPTYAPTPVKEDDLSSSEPTASDIIGDGLVTNGSGAMEAPPSEFYPNGREYDDLSNIPDDTPSQDLEYNFEEITAVGAMEAPKSEFYPEGREYDDLSNVPDDTPPQDLKYNFGDATTAGAVEAPKSEFYPEGREYDDLSEIPDDTPPQDLKYDVTYAGSDGDAQ